MRKILCLILSLTVLVGLLLTGCAKKGPAEPGAKEEVKGKAESQKEEQVKIEMVTITVDSKGSPADSTRGTNIVEAAKELNKLLEEQKDKRRVEVKHNHMSAGGDDDFNKKFFLACQSGGGSDILSTGHNNVALYAEGQYALQLDGSIAESKFKSDLDKIYPGLWEAAKYNGNTYAVPQDAETRPLYFRKDVLRISQKNSLRS